VEAHATSAEFKSVGDVICLLQPADQMSHGVEASEYLSHIHGVVAGDVPAFDLDSERRVQAACIDMIRTGGVSSAHDVSDGGLAVNLAESVLQSDGPGAEVDVTMLDSGRLDGLLFGEAQSRIVISCNEASEEELRSIAGEHGVQLLRIGNVAGADLVVKRHGKEIIRLGRQAMASAYENTIPQMMGV